MYLKSQKWRQVCKVTCMVLGPIDSRGACRGRHGYDSAAEDGLDSGQGTREGGDWHTATFVAGSET